MIAGNRPSVQDLTEVQFRFDLPTAALAEKDWYVIQALAALRRAHCGAFRLVFGGGTALSRAHRLTERMSEDIDLKIAGDREPTRTELRKIRDNITRALLDAGFAFDPENPSHRNSANASRYTLYRLPFPAQLEGGDGPSGGALRSEIKIETAVWPLRRPSVRRDVHPSGPRPSGNPPKVPAMPCADLTETVAEKFVALTRRAGTELASPTAPRDPTLIRHVYDLHVTREHYDVAAVTELAREIVQADVQAYGHLFPAYRNDPVAETHRAAAALATDPYFADAYFDFLQSMVYGEAPAYEAAVATIVRLADGLRP